MMPVKGLFILALLFLPSFGYALSAFESYTDTVDLSEGKAHETIEAIIIADREDFINLSLPPDVSNLNVYLNDKQIRCNASSEVGSSSLYCPLGDGLKKYFMKIELDSSYPVISMNGQLIFKAGYTPAIETNNFDYILKLPLGYVIPSVSGKEETFFVSPKPDNIYSDGRRVILSWKKEKADENFEVFVTSEKIGSQYSFSLIILLSAFALIAVFLIVLYAKGKDKKNIIINSLVENEEAVVDELSKAKGNELWQKQLQIKTGLSKVKLSRLLKSLEARKVITKEQYGNTNKIKLSENPKDGKEDR